MANLGPGRPRLEQRRRQGPTPRAEILDAAAELFTTLGYASTSTRSIADAVGIRQASLYHHFAAKDDILDALLSDTVASPLVFSRQLVAAQGSAAVRLYALARLDVEQLCASKWNLGALYLLPELRMPRFAQFRLQREELRRDYETLASAVIAEAGKAGVAGAEILPFRLVETVINMRSDAEDNSAPANAAQTIPDAILPLLGWSGDQDALHAEAIALLEQYK